MYYWFNFIHLLIVCDVMFYCVNVYKKSRIAIYSRGYELSSIVVNTRNSVEKIKFSDLVAIHFILSCGWCAECNLFKPNVCSEQWQPDFTMYESFA